MRVHSSRPHAKPVLLVTSTRHDPLTRTTRDLTRGARRGVAQHSAGGELAGDTELEAVMSCGRYTEHFNELLLHMPRPNLRGVQLVWARMMQEGVPPDLATYNLLLDRIADLREQVVFDIYAHMCRAAEHDAALRPNLTTFLCLVRACERWSDYPRAFRIYAQMREEYGVFPDLPLYNTLIGYCAPLHDETTAAFIIEEMRQRQVEPDVHTYNGLMNVFGEAPQTLSTLDEIQKRKLKPNRRTYNTLMKACRANGDYDRAFSLFEEMKRDGITPDVVSYNLLLASCHERMDYVTGEGAHAALRRTKEQKEIGLRAVAQLALHLLQEMESVQVQPNSFSYLRLLAIMARSAEPRIFDVLQRMRVARDAQGALVPSAGSDMASMPLVLIDSKLPPFAQLDSMLDAAASRALTAAGAEGGDKLGDYGVALTPEVFSFVFEGAAKLALPERAYRIFDEMRTLDGVEPTRDTYIKLLRVCAIKGDKHKATAVFADAKRAGIQADVHLFNAYLSVLAEKCDPLIFQVFTDLKEDRERLSVRPNEESYVFMLRALEKTHNLDHAIRLYDELRDPASIVPLTPTVYGLLIDICATRADRKRAAELVIDMRQRGHAPTAEICAKYMNVFVEANDPALLDVFEELKQVGPVPNLDVYTTVLKFYARNGNDTIYALFEEMKKQGVEPDLPAYNVMLSFTAKHGTPQRAFRLLDEIKLRGMQADIDTYNALLAVFASTGSDFIFKIFEQMNECRVAPDGETFAILLRHHEGRIVLQRATEQNLVKVAFPPEAAFM